MSSLTLNEHVSSLQGQVDFLKYICARLIGETNSSENIKREFMDLFKEQHENLSDNYLDGLERGFEGVFKEEFPRYIDVPPEITERVKVIFDKARKKEK